MDRARQIPQDVFQFPDFRAAQKEVIQRLLDDKNALILLPTGGGKSICFQIPALCFEGLTLVISPLISLMKDQVEALKKRNVNAANLNSTLTTAQASEVKNYVLNGTLKILYVAPERLNNEGFVHMMQRVRISLLAVDESHCISQWGASFRPEYLKIARFAEELNVERVVCLTATATQEVTVDICTSFHIDPIEGVFKTPIYRPNLSFQVTTAKTFENKMKTLVPFLRNRKGPSIVYVTLQKQAENVAVLLKHEGIDAMVYHAGLKAEQRDVVQNAFMTSKAGHHLWNGDRQRYSGYVVHLYLPKTLENFSQEVGRAGRDGLPSDCLLFLCAEDIPVLEGFARGDTCAQKTLEAKLYDICSNTLGLLYAQLELDFKFIRAVTPFYSVYEIRESKAGWTLVLSDKSPEAITIRRHWKAVSKYHKIDISEAAAHSGVERERLAKQISKWELDGLVESKGSQVRNRYIVAGDLPKDHSKIVGVARTIYDRQVAKEEEEVNKIRKVVAFGTSSECLARTLAIHFGDTDAIPGVGCAKCLVRPEVKTIADPRKVQAILNVCSERHDPRLLARFAFGIPSPRLTDLKLSRHTLFGSIDDVEYTVLLEVFEKVFTGGGSQLDHRHLSKKRPVNTPSATTKKAKR